MAKPSMASGSIQSWMSQDPSVLWTVVAGLAVVLLLLVRALRKKTAEASGGAGGMPTPLQTLTLIRNRRSVNPKDYLDAEGNPVTLNELHTMLEAANWAPTHQKTEPWRYVVMSGQDAIIKYLAFLDDWYTERSHLLPEDTVQKFRAKLEDILAKWPTRVSHLVLLVMKRQAKKDKLLPEWEEICATAMAVENFHLQATAMDIGVFWSSHTWCKDARDSPEMTEHFGFEAEDRIFGALTVGRYSPDAKFTSVRGSIDHKVQYRASV